MGSRIMSHTYSMTQTANMTAKLLKGKEVADSIRASLKIEIQALPSKPGLAVILMGDNPASKAYVGMKKKACAELGINSFEHLPDPSIGKDKLAALIQTLNEDPKVHGILLQLPLPQGYDEQRLLQLITPEKDVDGFHPVNVGKLLIGLPALRSCTPYGVMAMLDYYDIDTKGKGVVVIGRSNIVGKPLAAMLLQKGVDATVTICHSRSKNLVEISRQADIVIAAIGRPGYVTADMVKEGAVVIDVGINRVEDASTEKGYRLVGDVDFEAVAPKCAAITPVPGGVGPMTIAMLMKNTLQAYRRLRD